MPALGLKAKVVAGAGALLLGTYAAVGAFAAPGATPWPEPFDAPAAELPDVASEHNGDGDDDGLRLDSPACAGDLENPNPHDTDGDGDGCREVETEDGTKDLPDPAADAIERAGEHNGDGNNDDAGVPLDSPACAGDLENPNPRDTDGDGDGCREVETEDGTKNLPDPAADAHEGRPGDIGHQQRPPHAGPPEGVPVGGDDEEPEVEEEGDGPPDGVGRPDDVPRGGPPHTP